MADNKDTKSTEDKLLESYFVNNKGKIQYYKFCEHCKLTVSSFFDLRGYGVTS